MDIHVQTVVEVPKPEEVSETQRDVKGTELSVTQREQPQDVQVVLVPPTVGIGGGPQGQDSGIGGKVRSVWGQGWGKGSGSLGTEKGQGKEEGS